MYTIKNWRYLYKIDTQGGKCVLQHTYEPYINKQQTVLCLNFTCNNLYTNKLLGEKTVDFFFEREATNLQRFQSYEWCPKILDIDLNKKQIFIDFDGILCNHLETNKIESFIDQARSIIRTIARQGFGKISMHSHCFFVTRRGNLRTIDFFSCFPFHESLVSSEIVEEILSPDSVLAFSKFPFRKNDQYDMLEIYKFLLANDTWGSIKLGMKEDFDNVN